MGCSLLIFSDRRFDHIFAIGCLHVFHTSEYDSPAHGERREGDRDQEETGTGSLFLANGYCPGGLNHDSLLLIVGVGR